MLRKGILAKAEDPAQIASYNAYCGDPVKWFDNEYFRNHDLYCITFDFFVDWKNNQVDKCLWTKRIIAKPFAMTADEIYQKIVAVDGNDHLDRMAGFCNRYGFELEYILCPDIPADAWRDPQNHVFMFNITRYLEQKPDQEVLREVTAEQLKEIIRDIRKESHAIGIKGLKYATSSLEVYLSQSEYIYPGDADIVLIDKNYEVVAIIEVKKHTAYSERTYGPLEQENLYNYRDTDRLKYQSLGWLKEYLGCSLYMLYYSTLSGEEGRVVKFERVVGDPKRLHSVYPANFALPEVNNGFSLMAFQNQFLQYHYEHCKYNFDEICLSDSYQKGTPISKAGTSYLRYIMDPRNKALEKEAVKKYWEFAGTILEAEETRHGQA